jgi:hypothetical protein
MIFSYGFLEPTMQTAKVIFLDLQIPDDDPLRAPKQAISMSAPGFRIFDKGNKVGWESDFIWLTCVNEEDGLSFDFAVKTDGERELKAAWKDNELNDTASLKALLEVDPLWEVFQLRAVALMQDRVEAQLKLLYDAGSTEVEVSYVNQECRERPRLLALQLRGLERELLEMCYGDLEDEVSIRSVSPHPVFPQISPMRVLYTIQATC